MFLAWFKYRRAKKRNEFMAEVVSAIAKLNQRDRDLLCRAISLPATADGLFALTNMPRKELAAQCNQYYAHVSGNKWNVYDAFCKVIHTARKGK
ncbi:hypothetical protein MPK64_gp269 [Erwinia phage pEa_SNUABM_16]|uniref:Uncharacterized protein n=1 Tax=Erwinia phage pEa_SNUABM_16 TaxID=2869544 RepID=A0AAE9BU66_9CAUD|nr:hypothetical protein MPK64_gp269 [Erwinia phage pEa_SNUABM_16]UAW96413.1 hypothetical protein pEaSNUABM16_00269 [Erwinia phage pEa_SNUABM_16]